jgi:hypothetical protein
MTDDDLRAAAAKFAELDDGEQSRRSACGWSNWRGSRNGCPTECQVSAAPIEISAADRPCAGLLQERRLLRAFLARPSLARAVPLAHLRRGRRVRGLRDEPSPAVFGKLQQAAGVHLGELHAN